jgi:hypothetical protein
LSQANCSRRGGCLPISTRIRLTSTLMRTCPSALLAQANADASKRASVCLMSSRERETGTSVVAT